MRSGAATFDALVEVGSAAICCGFDGAAARIAGAKALVSGNRSVPTSHSSMRRQTLRRRTGALPVCSRSWHLGARVSERNLAGGGCTAGSARAARGGHHQCGAALAETPRAAYAPARVDAEVLPFISDIAGRYAAADLVICRAGANHHRLSLCAAGVPALLVPFVVRTTQHQRGNAQCWPSVTLPSICRSTN